MDLHQLQFPIGAYVPNKSPGRTFLAMWIEDIELFPTRVEALIKDVGREQLNWRYRPNGWMVKQVIHHCADSHMNSLIRFKLALTESTPTIKPYFEDRWAQLDDNLTDDVRESLTLLIGLHKKWVRLINSLTAQQLSMAFVHPDNGQEITLLESIGNYAWHCNHHLAHIRNGIQSDGRYG